MKNYLCFLIYFKTLAWSYSLILLAGYYIFWWMGEFINLRISFYRSWDVFSIILEACSMPLYRAVSMMVSTYAIGELIWRLSYPSSEISSKLFSESLPLNLICLFIDWFYDLSFDLILCRARPRPIVDPWGLNWLSNLFCYS